MQQTLDNASCKRVERNSNIVNCIFTEIIERIHHDKIHQNNVEMLHDFRILLIICTLSVLGIVILVILNCWDKRRTK